MPTPKNNTETVKKYRQKLKEEKGLNKLEIIGVTEADKKAFRIFKKESGIEKNSDAFRRLLDIAKIHDSKDYYIV